MGMLEPDGDRRPMSKHQIESSYRRPVQREEIQGVALERHYTVPEVAGLWGVSEKTVRRLFEGEDGVLRWGSDETLRKRGYHNLRIPQSVLIRVHRRRAS